MNSIIVSSKDPGWNRTITVEKLSGNETTLKKALYQILKNDPNSAIKSLEAKDDSYILNGNKFELSNIEKPAGIDIKIVHLARQNLKSNQRSLKEIQDDLFTFKAGQIPVIKFLWGAVIYPFSLLLRIFESPRPDPSPLKQKEDLETVIKWTLEVLEGSLTDDSLKDQLREFGKDQSAETILNRFNKAKNGDNLNLMPLGYWEDGEHFRPVLAAFYKNEKGHLALYQMNAGSTGSPKEYVWEKTPTKEELEFLLKQLKNLSEKPEKIVLKKTLDEKFSFETKEKEVLGSAEVIREELLYNSGAQAKVLSHTKERSDPWKMVQETLHRQFKDTPFADKALFTFSILNDRLQKLIQGESRLSLDEKRAELDKLSRLQERVERQLSKSFNTEHPFLIDLKKQIRDLKLRIQREEIAPPKNLHLLNRFTKSDYTIQVSPEIPSSTPSLLAVKQVPIISLEDKQLVDDLRIQERNLNPIKLASALHALETKLDKHIGDKNYEAAIELFKMASRFIPIDPKFVTELKDKQTIDQISKSLTRMTHYFWEAKLRTKQLPLTGSEWMGVYIALTLIYMMFDPRKKLITPEDARSNFSEDCLLNENYPNTDVFNLMSGLQHDDYLLSQADPELSIKFRKIPPVLKYDPHYPNVERLWYIHNGLPYDEGQPGKMREQMGLKRLAEFNKLEHSENDPLTFAQIAADMEHMKILVQSLSNTEPTFDPIDSKLDRLEVFKSFYNEESRLPKIIDRVSRQQGASLPDWLGYNYDPQGNKIISSYPHAMGSPKEDTFNRRYESFKTGSSTSYGTGGYSHSSTNNFNNTELSLLSGALYSDIGNPLLNWSKSVLEYKDYDLKGLAGTNIEEVFDLIITHPECLDKEEDKKKFLASIFRNGNINITLGSEPNRSLIEEHTRDHPEYYKETAPILRKIIEDSLKTKKTERALFLLLLCDEFKSTEFPKTIDYLPELIKIIKKPDLTLQERLELSNTIVRAFATHPDGKDPEKIPHFEEAAPYLLYALNTLSLAGDAALIPQLSWFNLDWGKQFFKAALLKIPGYSKVIDQWIQIQEKRGVLAGSYNSPSDNPFLLEKRGVKIDLNHFMILESEGKKVEGLKINLPRELLEHPYCKDIIHSKEIEARVIPTVTPGLLLYEFEEGGRFFRLARTIASQEISLSVKRNDRWLRYESLSHLAEDDFSGIEKFIVQKGIWRDIENPLKAAAIYKGEEFEIELDRKGKILEVSQPGRSLVHEKGFKFASFFKFLPEENVQFSAKPGSRVVTEVKITGVPIRLEREPKKGAPWVVQGGPYHSFEWGFDRELNKGLKEELLHLQLPIENVGLPLIDNKNSTHLILFPESEHPIDLVYKADGSLSTSAEGYLSLAKLLIERKEYERALHYINKAKNTPLNTKNLSLLRTVLAQIKELEQDSVRAVTLKLKAELAGIKIEREKNIRSNPTSSGYREQRKYIGGLINQLEELKKKSPFRVDDVKRGLIDNFGFDGEELLELKRLEQESLAFLLQKTESVQERSLTISPPQVSIVEPALFHYEKLKDPAAFIATSKRPNENLIKYFFSLYNHIIDNKLTVKDLGFLFGPIESDHSAEVDAARYYLIALAKREYRERIDLAEVEKLQSMIPGNLFTASIFPYLYKDSQEKFRAFSEKVFLKNPIALSFRDEEVAPNPVQGEKEHVAQLRSRIRDFPPPLRKFYAEEVNFKLLLAQFESTSGTLEELAELIFRHTNLNIETEIREEELSKEIERLEAKLKKTPSVLRWEPLDKARFVETESSVEELEEKVIAAFKKSHPGKDKVPKHLILEQALEAYQRGEDAGDDMLTYLIYKIELNQLNGPIKDLQKQLELLKGQEGDKEWEIVSKELEKAITSLNRRRYLDKEGHLIEPQFYRKFLVTELKNQIIMTENQIKLVKELYNHPTEFYKLKMGAGKTSVILPLIFTLLSEKSGVPIFGVVTQAMAKQSLDSLDSATRLLREKAGVEFSLDIKSPIPSYVLAEKYFRLLKTATDGGYTLTTIPAKASIEHLIALLYEEVKTIHDEKRLFEIEKELYWLKKIRAFTKSGLTIGDEVDDLTSILQEVNLAIGKTETLNLIICDVMEKVIDKIHNEDSLKPLRDALKAGKQSDFKDVSQMKENLVRELGKSKYREYLLGKGPAPIVDFEEEQSLQALKDILQTLPRALSQKTGINIDVKSDGFTIGPRDKTVEKEGMFFGQEYDQIVNHYISYAFKLPRSPFMATVWNRYYEANPRTAEKIEQDALAANKDLFTYINEDQNYKIRLDLLKHELIEKKEIRRFEKQYVMNVQETIMDESFGGVSGTLSRYQLPHSNLKQEDDSVNKEMRGLLKDSIVAYTADENDFGALQKDIDNYECKAIINDHFSLQGKNSLEVVTELRKLDTKKRIIIFIHPETRTECIWRPGVSTWSPITRQEIKELNLKADFRKHMLVYFGPPDTRGTDIKIPAGYGVVLAGKDRDSSYQAAGRLRGIGVQHKVEFRVLEPAIRDMETLENAWSVQAEKIKGTNSKADDLKITSIAAVGARKMLGLNNKIRSFEQKKERARDREFDVALYDAVTNFLIKSRKVELRGKQTVDVPIKEWIDASLKDQYMLIMELEAKIDALPDHQKKDEVLKIVADLYRQLKVQHDSFANFEVHETHLPSHKSTSEIAGSGAIELVQERAQEMETEHELAQETVEKASPVGKQFMFGINVDADDPDKYKTIRDGNTLLPVYFENTVAMNTFFLRGLGSSALMKEVLNSKVSFDRIVQRIAVRDFDVILISHTDYQSYDVPTVKARIKNPLQIYTLTNGEKDGIGFKLNRTIGVGRRLPTNSDLFKLAVVQLKWILGYSNYSTEERNIFKSWIDRCWNKPYTKYVQTGAFFFKQMAKQRNSSQVDLLKKVVLELGLEYD